MALINRSHVRKRGFVTYSLNPVSIGVSFLPVIIMIVIVSVTEIVIQVASHPSTIATPAKYTNQNYYIDTNDNLYVDHNGKMQFVEKPEQQLIQYNELAKSATVEFKTTKNYQPICQNGSHSTLNPKRKPQFQKSFFQNQL